MGFGSTTMMLRISQELNPSLRCQYEKLFHTIFPATNEVAFAGISNRDPPLFPTITQPHAYHIWHSVAAEWEICVIEMKWNNYFDEKILASPFFQLPMKCTAFRHRSPCGVDLICLRTGKHLVKWWNWWKLRCKLFFRWSRKIPSVFSGEQLLLPRRWHSPLQQRFMRIRNLNSMCCGCLCLLDFVSDKVKGEVWQMWTDGRDAHDQ